jgi:RND family efflux transporter MFP subunit
MKKIAIRAERMLFRARHLSRLVPAVALLTTVSWTQTAQAQVNASLRRDAEPSSTQPGTAEAFYEADLGAKVSGFVSELNVDIGAHVEAGQVLARIAVPELTQARNAARARVAALESEHERTAMLVARSSMTQRALDEAKSRLETAIAEQAEIEARMQYAVIEAPFAGIVTSRTIDPGDMVYEASSPKGSDEPLLRVAKIDVIRVKTYVPESEAALVVVGDQATIVFDALPGTTFASQVARISGSLDPGTRTMLVEIDLPNDDGRIRPGYYGRTHIVLGSAGTAAAP